MSRITITTLACLGALWGCGGEAPNDEPALTLAFQQHALMCDIPGCYQIPAGVPCIKAKVTFTGVQGVCLLDVQADRTVSGACRIPAHEVRDLRLEYYTTRADGQGETQLAVVLARVDLREETRDTIQVSFPQSHLTTNFDDDGDMRINIEEVCAGTDPHSFD